MLMYKPTPASRDLASLASLVLFALVIALGAHFARTPAAHAAAAPATPATARAPKAPAAPAAPQPLHIVSLPATAYARSSGRTIDTVVVHYTSAILVDKAHWDDPTLNRDIFNKLHVSSHYMIGRDGTIYRLVDEDNIAYHAGGSIMPAPDNRKMANRFSVGVELIATDRSGFTDAQYQALTALIKDMKTRHPITHIVGHDDIGGQRAVSLGLRKDVKPDPGPLFDWTRLHNMLGQ